MSCTFRSIALLSLAVLLTAGCSTSDREKATGDAPIMGINTILESPDVNFKIEERSLGQVSFAGVTTLSRWDDLSYDFNFDISVPGAGGSERLASQFLDVQKDRVYQFVLSGTIDNPEVTLYDSEERQWSGDESVFEMTFAHFNGSAGPVDVYFQAAGGSPVAGNQVATLEFGERAAIAEFTEGDYELLVTPANDPQTLLFTSAERTYQAASTGMLMLLDRDPSRTADMVVRHITATGGNTEVSDPRFAPTARFVHAVSDIGSVDVAENDDFAALKVSDQAFGELSGDVEVLAGTNDYTWTDSGNQGAILLESEQSNASGFRSTLLLVGPADDLGVMNILSARRSFATSARVSFVHAAANHEAIDIYLLPAGASVADSAATASLTFRFVTGMTPVAAGDYEITITTGAEKTVLAGPVPVDLALRDVVEVILLDTADPNVAEIRVVQNAP